MRLRDCRIMAFVVLLGISCFLVSMTIRHRRQFRSRYWLNNFRMKKNPSLVKVNENFLQQAKKQSAVHSINNQETTHIAFLKVHKTASSTAQNVFLRFGDTRNLTFILAHTAGESGYLNVISYRNSLTAENIVPAPPGRHFDILCCHVIYNRKQFERVLPADTVYIGIVREPVSRFQSAIKYFSPGYILKLNGANPISVYAQNPLQYEPDEPKKSQFNNRMAVEFGFPSDLFPGKSLSRSKPDIDKYLSKLDQEFDFIIISEAFAESMVYMRRVLHWKMKDVLFLDKNVASKQTNRRKKLLDEDRAKIKDFLYLDDALYSFALARFHKQISQEGQDFVEEVAFFEKVRGDVSQFCREAKKKSINIDRSKWSEEFIVTTYDCKQFKKHEKDLIQKQRFRIYGTLHN